MSKSPYVVIIFHPDGRVEQSFQAKAPSYEQLREAVGGPIETVPYLNRFNGHVRGTAYANEEGIMRRLSSNIKASELWWQNLEHSNRGPYHKYHLHGPVVFYAKYHGED